jgi:ribonuclease HII
MTTKNALQKRYREDNYTEIGIDEAGRGPMIGRVYAAAVILPINEDFKHYEMKDSKRFHSEKKLRLMSEYIKENAVAWGIGYATEKEIDLHNIRKATHTAMHRAIKIITDKVDIKHSDIHILVDGNDFTPYIIFEDNCLMQVQTSTIEQGDNKITSIAAASILAKVARDEYITELCAIEPELHEKYGLLKNKGYGTKQHLDGIREHGISQYHRATFGICKQFNNIG